MGADEQGLTGLRQLQALLAYPREGLDVEIKAWLDLDYGEQAAALIKAILALANHGGGYILIGLTEADGVWQPDEQHRPSDLSQYDQDRLNGLITRYAEPPFHCELHHVPHPESQALFPVVVVPPGRVPIRAKRESPETRQIRKDSYYIRRPGPKSETPQTGQEWADFLRRCTLSDREHLLEDLRRLLQGRRIGPSVPERTAEERLDEWVAASEERWRRLVADRQAADRYRYGVITYSYIIEGDLSRPTSQELLGILERVKGRETGWPMWVVFRGRGELAPRSADGTIESIFIDTVFEDPSHSDYWRASADGRMFLLRGYEEDGEPEKRPPGTTFDFTIPVWRFGEALRHSERLARALGDPQATINFRASWSGLEGRHLRSLWARRVLGGEYVARQDSVVSYLITRADDVSPRLAELLQQLLAPLYDVFDFFEMPPRVIEEELATMLERA